MTADPVGIRRRFLVAAGTGALLALVLFVVVMQSGRSGWLHDDLFGGFYDAQARSLLDGRLDVDPDVPGIEGFRMDDGTYIYQGIAPTIARLPLLAATSRLDGRTTGLSMVAAAVVLLAYVVAVAWIGRRTFRPDAELGRGDALVTAAVVFAAGSGSTLFLAGQVWVYHEALMWGAALALGSFTHLLAWMAARDGEVLDSGRAFQRHDAHLVIGVLLAGLALNSRSSVGVGPMAAWAAVAALLAVDALRPRGADSGRVAAGVRSLSAWQPAGRVPSLAGLAVVVAGLVGAVGVHVAVNVARFGSLIGVPLERQVLVEADPLRLEALAANDGSLFGLRYAPSVVLQLLRPDTLQLRPHLPFVGFPSERPSEVGNVLFAELDWSSSLPSSQPLLFVGAVIGVVAVFAGRGATRRWRLPVMGAALGVAPIIVFGYIAHRYLVDALPLLVVAGVVGWHTLSRSAGGWARPIRRGVGVVVVVSAVFGAWVNTSLALQYQREIAPQRTEGERAGWLAAQQRLGGRFDVVEIEPGAPAPDPGPIGQLLVVGDCDALLRSNGARWFLIENAEGGGGVRLELADGVVPAGPTALMRSEDDGVVAALVVEPIEGASVRLVAEVDRGDPAPERSFVGPPFAIGADGPSAIEVQMDHRADEIVVRDAATGDELLRVEIDLPTAEPEPVPGVEFVDAVSGLATPRCDQLRG